MRVCRQCRSCERQDSIAMAESASTPGSNGLTSTERNAANGMWQPPQATQATANSRKLGAGTQDEQDHFGALAASAMRTAISLFSAYN